MKTGICWCLFYYRLATKSVAFGGGQAIAWVPIAGHVAAYATAARGAGLLVTRNGCARKASKLGACVRCRFAQTVAQQREWLRGLCVELLREKAADLVEDRMNQSSGLWTGRLLENQAVRGANGGFSTV